MDLELTDEQRELGDLVDGFLRHELPHATLQAVTDGALFERGLWRRTAALGLFGLSLPDGGASVVEDTIAMQVAGRHLAPIEFVGSILGAHLADRAGAIDRRDLIADGHESVAVALPDAGGGVDLLVPPGATTVVSFGPDVADLYTGVDLDVAERIECIDPLTALVHLPAIAKPPTLTVEGDAAGVLHRQATLLAAAMAVGVAQSARDASVSYAKDRVQFGRPIGVNQAVKHACANVAVRCEAAAAQLLVAALSLREDRPDSTFQVAAAKEVAVDAAYLATRTNIQVHGGMGFTWEHAAHLLLTRTHLLDELFGNRRAQQAVLLSTSAVVA